MRLEKELRPIWEQYKLDPNPTNTGELLRGVEPIMQRGIYSQVGQNTSPVLRSQARKLTLEAFQSYDPNRASMSTHINHHLQRLRRLSRQTSEGLRIPEGVIFDHARITEGEEAFREKHGREPTIGELSDALGLSRNRIKKVRRHQMPISAGQLESGTDESEDSPSSGPAVQGKQLDDSMILQLVQAELNSSNQKILAWSTGLLGEEKLSNKEIARRLNLTPSAVTQRKAKIQEIITRFESELSLT